METSINDVRRFLAIFDLPTYQPKYLPTLSYPITSDLGGYLGPLISDVINGRFPLYLDFI